MNGKPSLLKSCLTLYVLLAGSYLGPLWGRAVSWLQHQKIASNHIVAPSFDASLAGWQHVFRDLQLGPWEEEKGYTTWYAGG